MRQVEFVPFRLTDVAEIYSIRIEGKENSEIQEFSRMTLTESYVI